ncbi:MAG: enoyl-CoA hydratase/isomerase family protein [Sphingomonadaceae bacterium]|nr:enoyl-CoA hydratase/isomerase family protein [Sphingomonadaceae bacterium]
MTRDAPALTLAIDGPRATLTLDRPAKRNALDLAMWEELPRLVAAVMLDPGVRVLVVTGAGGAFSAGADLDEFAVYASDPAWRARNNAAIRATQVTLARAAKPVVAAIDGDAIGGGLGLALACDLRFATPRARLGLTPAKLGLVYPLHDTKLLVDLVGPAQAKRMLFTARVMDAAEAARIGLVDEVTDDLDGAVDAFCARVADLSATTQLAAKRIVRRILDGASDDDAASAAEFDAAFTGADFAAGIVAFRGRPRG